MKNLMNSAVSVGALIYFNKVFFHIFIKQIINVNKINNEFKECTDFFFPSKIFTDICMEFFKSKNCFNCK